jgi:hypothetical protein
VLPTPFGKINIGNAAAGLLSRDLGSEDIAAS